MPAVNTKTKEACAVLYHIVLEGPRNTQKWNVITAHAIKRRAVIHPPIFVLLKIS